MHSSKPHIPERTCVGCFQRFPQASLLTVTRLKDQSVVFDPTARRAGRSVYLCRQWQCYLRATKRKGKNAFEYGLKVTVPPTILDEIGRILQPNA